MVAASFTGEYPQRIDGKGRMSIPADFRKVLEAGHPSREAGELPSLYLLYGAHLRDHLEAFTVQAFGEVAERITAIRPRTPEEAEKKALSTRLILGQSVRLELDRDGRVVMPAARRAQLGLAEGEVVFSGAGDHFEIWNALTYEEAVGARMRAFLDAQGDGFDPMTLVWSLGA